MLIKFKDSNAFLLLLLLFSNCNSKPPKNNKQPPQTSPKIQPLTIAIQPLGNISESYCIDTYTELKEIVPNVVLAKRMSMPSKAYYAPRKRYRADSLIHWLRERTKPNQVFVGITMQDISTKKGNVEDYGVMGLGYCPGNACIVSSFRLKNKPSFFKVVVHELGHTTGLPHCPVKTCFMRDAEGGNPTAEEKEFCSKCKDHLIKNGWHL